MPDSAATRLKRLWTGWPGWGLRVAFAVLPIAYIIRSFDLHKAVQSAMSVELDAALLAIGLAYAGTVVGAMRWRTLLRAYGAAQPPGPLTLMRLYLVSIYFNLLPAGVAGEAVRGYRVKGCVKDLTTSYVVILVERLTGLVALLLFVVATTFVGGSPRNEGRVLVPALEIGAGLALALAAFVLFLPYRLSRDERLRGRLAGLPLVGKLLLRLPPTRAPWGVLAAIGWSFGTQAQPILTTWVIARAVFPTVTLFDCVRVVPFILLLTFIPLTPAGVGQREILSIHFLGLVGVPAGEAVAVSVLTFGVIVVQACSGGVLQLVDPRASHVPKEDLERASEPD